LRHCATRTAIETGGKLGGLIMAGSASRPAAETRGHKRINRGWFFSTGRPATHRQRPELRPIAEWDKQLHFPVLCEKQ
jgi:hypothetical protein